MNNLTECSSRYFYSAILLFFIAFPFQTQGQDFDQGLQYYQQKEYQKAVSAFNNVKNSQGYLFTAKSFYALGKYDEAQSNLNNVADDAPVQIYYEAMYTSGLVDFQRKRFGNALSKLHRVSSTDNLDSNLALKSKQLYRQILNYLAPSQRFEAIESISSDEIRFNLLESGMGKMNYSKAKELYDTFRNEVDDNDWEDKSEDFESDLQSASTYENKYGRELVKLQPPNGTIYTIGIALPEYKPEAREFEIVKAMYLGALVAAEDFNKQNRGVKTYLRFTNTKESVSSLEPMVQQFVENKYGDALVGPLFSEQAEPLVSIATDFKTPTIAPLANSQLNLENSYLFQANPTFSIHGKQMAQYAVNQMGIKNFAVIASENTNGAQSARAFREEVQRLGGNINYFYVENLESNEYEISRYTKYFSSEEPVEAVYAPFTGRSAVNLIDLLIRDLREMNTVPTLLGSQEYQNIDYKAPKYQGVDILFSGSNSQNNRGADLYQFKNKYQQMFGITGNQYAMIGYDITQFILEALQEVGNPELLREALTEHPKYQGLIRDIYFNGGNINEVVNILTVTSSGEIQNRN